MTREQKMLAVVEAAQTLMDGGGGPKYHAHWNALAIALSRYRALLGQPQPQGETVEVAVNMWRNAASGEWCPVMVEDDDDDPERDRAWQHVGTLTARIPLPVAPTISATVTREGGE